MQTGTVKLWKGTFGFIKDDGGRDIFVHQTQIQMEGYRELHAGQRVQFSVGANKQGCCAQDVTVIGE